MSLESIIILNMNAKKISTIHLIRISTNSYDSNIYEIIIIKYNMNYSHPNDGRFKQCWCEEVKAGGRYS
jgi:hypothetical protein